MAKEYSRADRIADAVQRFLAEAIRDEIRDPRLGLVNINAVTVSRDLAQAKVYVTFVGQEEREACQANVDILNNAAGFLRILLGKELTMRSVPKLFFYFDESSIRGQALTSLINKAIAADEKSRRERGD